MFNPNPRRPITRRQSARIVLAVAILAWATQTMLQQWGFGAPPDEPGFAPAPALALVQNETVERFIPPPSPRPARLELRAEATVIGEEVRLKQVARWSEQDAATFAPVADLVLFRVGRGAPFRSVTLEDVRATLRDAGVNLAAIHVTGATRCVVNRSDARYDEGEAMEQWIAARRDVSPEAQAKLALEANPSTRPSANPLAIATDANVSTPARVDAPAEEAQGESLRAVLIRDLAQRLRLNPDALQLSFRPADDKVLALSPPHFRFDLQPVRAGNLGEVAWNVTITADDGSQQRASVVGRARAWQAQVLTARAISLKQIIREDDLAERRVLVDRLGDDAPLAAEQVIGQQASRDIKPGTVLTARLVDPVPLVRPGQFVTITLSQGNIQVKTVARALEGGAFGQTIRVKNETTRDVFKVVVTGPQAAAMAAPPTPEVTEVSSAGQER